MLFVLFTAFLLGGVSIFVAEMTRRRRRGRLPPGPRGIPLIGNALDFPRSHFGPEFAKMARRHGDIMHLNLFGQSIIVLGSYEVAVDLLERRSANYSNRPRSIMAKLTGYDDWVFVLMQYGQKWRRHRRILTQSFHPEALEFVKPTLTTIAHDLLQALSATPERFSEHVGFAVARSTMRIVYGIQLTSPDDRFYHMAETIVDVGQIMGVPGAFPVDTFPVLQYFPSWLPGGRFKKLAAAWKTDTGSYRDQLFAGGMAAVDDGIVDSLVGKIMRPSAEFTISGPQDKDSCRGAAATAYSGGADTTHAAIHFFLLLMATHKAEQEKAQAELDAVVGPDRLPTFADRDALPYMNALIKEVLRWHVISPVGVAHRSVVDDVYDGYLIPAGSVLFPNAWAMSRDETQYPDPECFRPERFLRDGKLDPAVRDPAAFVFGFGRRICPGLHFVDANLFIVFASVLHALRIGYPLDAHGVPVPPRMEFVATGLTARPKPFGCTIEPRSPHAAQLIRSLSEQT